LAALASFLFVVLLKFLKDCSRIKGSLAPGLFEITTDEIKKKQQQRNKETKKNHTLKQGQVIPFPALPPR